VDRQLASHRSAHPGPPQLADTAEFSAGFAALICAAQESVRQCSSGERAAASLRDVARCAKVFCWLLQHVGAAQHSTSSTKSSKATSSGSSSGTSSGSSSGNTDSVALFGGAREGPQAATRRAVVLALAFCYHARLPRDDREVSRRVSML
jgi:hypothetical protein